MNLPPIPTWQSAHPIIVHIPLGALPVAALLVLCALFSVKSRKAWSGAALLVLAIGTVGLFFAARSGEATEHAVVIPQVAKKVFREHEHTGLFVRNFSYLILASYALLAVGAAVWSERMKRWVWIGGHVAVLALCGYNLINLANTGHLGGRVVHEFGVHAPLAGTMDPAERAKNLPVEDDHEKPAAR